MRAPRNPGLGTQQPSEALFMPVRVGHEYAGEEENYARGRFSAVAEVLA